MKENKNNNSAMFIKTQDSKTSENLKQAGFELVDCSDGIWTFINNPNYTLTFGENKVFYSNMLCI